MRPLIRPATMVDVWRLRPVMARRLAICLSIQLAESDTFALCHAAGPHGGEVFAVGGLWPDPDGSRRVCWMMEGLTLPARALVEGVRWILDTAPPGPRFEMEIDAGSARDIRFAEFLGFRPVLGDAAALSSADGDAPSVPARILRMERA